MATYSYSQLEGIWTQGGGSAALAPVMAAIALAESSGNPSAIGPGGSWGLWQIQPQDWGFNQTTDPVAQAQDANQVLSKQGLSAWSTYNNGSYRQFYSPGTAPSSVADQAQSASLTSSSTPSGPGPCVWAAGSFCMDGLIGWTVAISGVGLLALGMVAAGRAVL